MKKLFLFMCLCILGCGTENYTIRPSYSASDTVYVISNTGRNPAYSLVDVIGGAVKFCDEKNRHVLFVSKYSDNKDVKFLCVK